jgi:hypothetical protein
MARGNISEALAQFEKAEQVILALAKVWPDHPGIAHDLARVQADIARCKSVSPAAS